MINFISDAAVITKRQLLQLSRVPELLLFSTIQPIMFVLLFRYVFGGSIELASQVDMCSYLCPAYLYKQLPSPWQELQLA